MKWFLCAFVICFIVHESRCAKPQAPKINLTGFVPKGIRVSIADFNGLEEFYFWGNINKKIDNRNNADIKLSAFEATDGEWVAEDQITVVSPGDEINYYLYYKKNGEWVKYESLVATVSDIKQSTSSVETEKVKPIVPKVPSPLDSCPEIKVKSRDVVVDFYGHSDIEKANLDKLTYLKIDECNVEYKLATGSDPSLLEIKIF